jgi:hypothetical protein
MSSMTLRRWTKKRGSGIIWIPHKDFVAQLVEQLTLNQRVQSSSLCGVTDNQALRNCKILGAYFFPSNFQAEPAFSPFFAI